MKQSILKDNIQAAVYLSDAITSTYGPKGMNKLLVDNLGESFITNDGATIIDKIEIQHPIAKLVAKVGETMNETVSDGSATGIILTGELLKQANQLIEQGLHPSAIIKGYEQALKDSIKIINELKKPIKNIKDLVKTTVRDEILSRLVIDASREVSTSDVLLITKTGKKEECIVYNGVGLDKEPVHPRMPRQLKGAQVLITKTPIEVRTTNNEAEIKINNPLQLNNFIKDEERIIKDIVNNIKNSGVNVVIAQKGIDERAQEYLAREGIMALRRVRVKDVNALLKATGAKLVSDLKNINQSDLGFAGIVTVKKVGDEKMTFLTACPGKARTIVIKGATTQSIIEYENNVKKGLGVTRVARLTNECLLGAGWTWNEISKKLNTQLKGKEQLSYDCYKKAIKGLIKVLIKNDGQDIHEINKWLTKKEDVIEPALLIQQALTSATEITNLILRIDEVIVAQ